jgi:ABC-2 type transport system permease protein
MIALIRTELLRLRTTRGTWGLLAIALVLTLGWTVAVLAGMGGAGAPARGSTEMRNAVLSAAGVGIYPLLILGVVAVTSEFHHGTVTPTFLVTPNRWRVLAAKAVACVLVAPLVVVVLLAVAWTAGVLAGAIPPTFRTDLLGLIARSMLVCACWALLGVGVGAAVRNQTIAVIVPLVWLLGVETLIPPYGLIWLVPWLPGGVSAALSGAQFAGALPLWAALLVLVAYAVVLLLPSARSIARRDIT